MIFEAAVAAVDPTQLTRRYLRAHRLRAPAERFLVVGVGKAAARMAAGCEGVLGASRTYGLVIAPDGYTVPLTSVKARTAGHPLPDRRGIEATEALCHLLATASEGPVICLISGGASSLLVRPRSPVTLVEKMAVNRLLLACGADITEMNAVRKHLSTVKGGGLLRIARARPFVTLVLSDVIGDDPSVIGSGPATPDPSTFAQALRVLSRYALVDRIPPAALDLLERGRRGEVPETVKPGGVESADAVTAVIGNNQLALAAAAAEARRLGYEPLMDPEPLAGDTTTAARRWLHGVRARIDGRRRCAIAGGETTVVVRGRGRGGRNQEFALALAEPLAGASVAVLSAGTDGIDGPTDAAGAFVDGQTLERARAAGLDPSAALAANDAYGFFNVLGELLRCGPTGTNVMDVKLAVGMPSP
jgi:glycerate-2-kinase